MDWDAPLSGDTDLWSGAPVRRSADPLSPWFVDPKVSEITDRHPTVDQIRDRDREIVAWAGRMDRFERDRRLHAAMAWVPFGFALAALGFVVAGSWVGVGVALLCSASSTLVGAWVGRTPDPGLPPAHLVLRPYEDAENAFLVSREEPTRFIHACGCPGCGDFAVHGIVRAGDDGLVVRRCLVCRREWAQQ